MKLSEILNYVNTFEKNSFLRIIDQIISSKPKNYKEIEKILSQIDGQLKNADNESVAKVLMLVEDEYADHIRSEFANTTSQLDILIDIVMRDGNALMKREWLLKLYDREVAKIKSRIKDVKALLDSDNDEPRTRDYRVYQACLVTAFNNDIENNREKRITQDEQTILNTLIHHLELSHEEVKLINYSVVPLKKLDIDELITYLVRTGIVMYSKKNHQVFVPDELVDIFRKIRGKLVPDKVFRRVLRQLKDSQINLLARRHNIDWKSETSEKIKSIISEGINFSNALIRGIHKDGTTKTARREVINELIEKKLNIEDHIKGASLEAKVENFIEYLNFKEKEGNISISVDGYNKLIADLQDSMKQFEKVIRTEYEIQDGINLNADTFLKYNLKPLDVLYALNDEMIKDFCTKKGISTRGNEVSNILEVYKDTENLYLENYIHISNRDLNTLYSNGIEIKESELGVKFEDLTKKIFYKMGFNVDEVLCKNISNAKNKVDIVLNMGNQEVIVIECKSKKDKSFNNYSRVSRQVKAYKEVCEKNGYRVVKSFILAPCFTDDFVNECGLDYELNLSLITANSLSTIYEAYKNSGLNEFPYQILLRDVLINEERVAKALTR